MSESLYSAYRKGILNRDTVQQAAIDQLEGHDAGFCIHCGHKQEEVRPRDERTECESCGNLTMYGAEALVMLGEGV